MAVNRRGSERDSDFNQPFERSPYAIPIGENRSPSSQASVGRQRISREEGTTPQSKARINLYAGLLRL